jgi:hypothetical protein
MWLVQDAPAGDRLGGVSDDTFINRGSIQPSSSAAFRRLPVVRLHRQRYVSEFQTRAIQAPGSLITVSIMSSIETLQESRTLASSDFDIAHVWLDQRSDCCAPNTQSSHDKPPIAAVPKRDHWTCSNHLPCRVSSHDSSKYPTRSSTNARRRATDRFKYCTYSDSDASILRNLFILAFQCSDKSMRRSKSR